MDLDERFKLFHEEFLEVERISERHSTRNDLNAFMILDRLVPGMTCDIVSGAEHDMIWLDFIEHDLNAAATDEDIKNLIRCGVSMQDGALVMYV
jgi:hypothetical protein